MLAPNVQSTETTFNNTLSAESVVSIYAYAIILDVPGLLAINLPSWFAPIKTDLEAMLNHAKTWSDTLCINISSGIPQDIINYNSIFQLQTVNLLNLISEMEANPDGHATASQQSQAATILKNLSAHLYTISGSIEQTHTDLVNLMNTFSSDHTKLVTDATIIEREIYKGSEIIDNMTATLGNDFLNSTVEGPCSVAVTVKADIDIKFTEAANGNNELLPYVLAMKLLENLGNENETATQALSSVLTIWQTLYSKVNAIVTQVQQASLPDVAPILQKLDIQTAQNEWVQLKIFAEGLSQ